MLCVEPARGEWEEMKLERGQGPDHEDLWGCENYGFYLQGDGQSFGVLVIFNCHRFPNYIVSLLLCVCVCVRVCICGCESIFSVKNFYYFFHLAHTYSLFKTQLKYHLPWGNKSPGIYFLLYSPQNKIYIVFFIQTGMHLRTKGDSLKNILTQQIRMDISWENKNNGSFIFTFIM